MSNFFKNIHPLLRRNRPEDNYDDPNFAILNALNYELTQAEQETISSKIQSSLESATDVYLDTWGDWFGVYRKDGWDDEYYRKRILRELLLKRGTVPAIIEALVDFLNDNDAIIQIYEPWRNIFYTNKSKLNGEDHLMGYYYRFAIIDIAIDRPFPQEILEIIKAFKPAGVLFYLRLDTSLAKNKAVVDSPYTYLDVTNTEELDYFNGLYYDLRGNINLSDQRTQVVENNIFHTNNSKLNGADVLAGAFDHGRGYIHLASTTLLDYTPKPTDSMSDLKTTLGEAGSDMYSQTIEADGRTASIQVPAAKNIHTLYSNSTDFGDYDYSGKPNVLITDADTFKSGTGGTLTYNNGEYTVLMDGTARLSKYNTDGKNSVYLEDKVTYTISCEMYVGSDYTGNVDQIFANYAYLDDGYTVVKTSRLSANAPRDTWIKASGTATTDYKGKPPRGLYLSWQTVANDTNPTGTLKIRNLKIERGETSTPYQPSLLGAPYYLSKVPLRKNIADSSVPFPIKTSGYQVYSGDMAKPFNVGEWYTITIKATKPSRKSFAAYSAGTILLGYLQPVEGLSNVWSNSFKISKINATYPNRLQLYQLPNDNNYGDVQIDWIKIEKGNIRTPNIDSYEYVGSLVEDTETPTLDPTKYNWTINRDVTNKKAYMTFDVKTFIEDNYAIEFKKLVADLGEAQALNTVFENFIISTTLKALVSPSSLITFSVELYDFSTNAWHKLNTDTLDLRMRTFNLVANRITDYLNDYKLLFVRYVFDNETDKNVTVELDALNILFNYRLGDGYSFGLQSSVDCLSEIPVKNITLNKTNLELGINEKETLVADLSPQVATNKEIDWVSAEPKIAEVTDTGVVTIKSLGATTVTAYADNRNVSTKCTVSGKNRYNLYSNSTDFGDYDYSGNPNLMTPLKAADFSTGAAGCIIENEGGGLKITFPDSDGEKFIYSTKGISALSPNTNYTLSLDITVIEQTKGDLPGIGLTYRKTPGGTIIIPLTAKDAVLGKKTRISTTVNSSAVTSPESFERMYFSIDTGIDSSFVGTFLIENIKLEKSSKATPYQPNLLESPYYLSATPLGANIANPKQTFPIKTSDYYVYGGTNTENYVANQAYTITMKASKPSTQSFGVYINDGVISVGTMTSVEGVADTWSLTFTVTKEHIDKGVTNMVQIYQLPKESVGACQIEWVKLEKGATRTPNISKYTYRGTVLSTSTEAPRSPKDYTWSNI